MNYKEIKEATDPAGNELWDLLSQEEKECIQGMGAGVDIETGKPHLYISFRNTNERSLEFAKKWHGTMVLGIEVRTEVRPIARLH